jgi:hypothetical protein
MDLDNFSGIIRNLIIQENELENKKINWLIIFNGILISGFVQLSGEKLMVILIAGIGIIISVSFWWSFVQGHKAVDFLISKWNEKLKYHDKYFDEFAPIAGIPCYRREDPKYKSQRITTFLGKIISPSKVISPVFVLTWMFLLIYKLVF